MVILTNSPSDHWKKFNCIILILTTNPKNSKFNHIQLLLLLALPAKYCFLLYYNLYTFQGQVVGQFLELLNKQLIPDPGSQILMKFGGKVLIFNFPLFL